MSCYHSAVINASVEEVWMGPSNFHQLEWAPKVITSLKPVGKVGGTEVGARRVLNGVFHETLLSVDPLSHSLSYSIDDGPGVISRDAVSNFLGFVKLHPITVGGQTCIEWGSEYESVNPEAVADFCDPIFNGLLEGLQAHFA